MQVIVDRRKYFDVSLGPVTPSENPETKVTINYGLFRIWEPRIPSIRSIEEDNEILKNPDNSDINRLNDILIAPAEIVITKNCKIFLKIDTTPVLDTTTGLMYFGSGEGLNRHRDFSYNAAMALALSKRYTYSFSETSSENYVVQDEFPESIPQNNLDPDLSKNEDSVELSEDLQIMMSSKTHILIAEILLDSDRNTIKITQKHRGPLIWYSPKIFYGDFDLRNHPT